MSTLSAVNTASGGSDVFSSVLGAAANVLASVGTAAVTSTLAGVFQQKPSGPAPAPASSSGSTPGVSPTAPAPSAPIAVAAPQPKSEGAAPGFLEKYGELLLVAAAVLVGFKVLK